MCGDSGVLVKESRWSPLLLRFVCKLGELRLETGDASRRNQGEE